MVTLYCSHFVLWQWWTTIVQSELEHQSVFVESPDRACLLQYLHKLSVDAQPKLALSFMMEELNVRKQRDGMWLVL